jgi:predicted DNA-binding antitoxin AbrB/MazE fold protein
MEVTIRAKYIDHILRPLSNLNLKEGEEVEIIVKKSPIDRLESLVKISNKKWLDEIIESPDLEPV